jgi:hypothetical protein
VVKDPTQPGPSLVTEVKDSSLTILHQIYSVTGGFYISYRYRREVVRTIEGFQQEGALEELDPFDLGKEKEIQGVCLLRYLGGGHSAFLGLLVVCLG